MSIVSRSYFLLTQLILTFCDRVEKNCEVIKDDKNLTRTDEKCQFPFKFKVCGKKALIDNLFNLWGKRVWQMHLLKRQKMPEVLFQFDVLSKLESLLFIKRWCPTKLDESMWNGLKFNFYSFSIVRWRNREGPWHMGLLWKVLSYGLRGQMQEKEKDS